MKRMIQISTLMAIVFLTGICCKSSGSKDPLRGKGEVYKILHYASLAGSSHNSQPWKVEVYKEDSILIYADTERVLSVVDKTGRELYISIGAFIENLRIAASNFSYDAVVKINNPLAITSQPVATIYLSPAKVPRKDFDLKDVELRTTLRIPFKADPIKDEDIKMLLNYDNERIHFFSSASSEGKFIAANELAAFEKQSRDSLALNELAQWIRFSDKDVNEKRDGLTPAGMGIKGLAGFFVRNFYTPNDSKKESFVVKGIEKTQRQVENCGGWIIVSHEDDNISGWLHTGILYERLNIGCRKLNVGFHPMNQIIEEAEFENRTKNQLKLQGKILFVARIGYVNDYTKPVSLRRPVESFSVFK